MHRKATLAIIAALMALIPLVPMCAQDDAPADSLAYYGAGEQEEVAWDVQLVNDLHTVAIEASETYFMTGLCVYDLTQDTLLFGYNHKKVMRPASIEKILTGVAALDILGPEHQYNTRAYYTGTITPDSTLNGNIYVVGDFDPTYTYDDLKSLAQQICDLGIRRISGSILADISMKDSTLYGEGWCWDDVPSKFEPYLPALLFDRGQDSPSSTKYSANPNFRPWLHFVHTLGQLISKAGIVAVAADGSMLAEIPYGTAVLPLRGAQPFYSHTTSLEQVLQRVMKNSDNLYAESMLYHLAKLNAGRWSTWKDGVRQIENVIRKAGASTSFVNIVDGSGVSLYDYHTPETQVAMLRYAYRMPRIFNALYPALPIAGQDGTLSSRMRTGCAHLNVRAKTGTLTGVSSLAGYVTASNGHMLAFAIINNGVLKSATAHALQDRICQMLAR